MYCHLSEIKSTLVENETILKQGDIFGKAGDSGNAKGQTPHCHVEVSNSSIFYGGTDRFDPEMVFVTKYDNNGNSIN